VLHCWLLPDTFGTTAGITHMIECQAARRTRGSGRAMAMHLEMSRWWCNNFLIEEGSILRSLLGSSVGGGAISFSIERGSILISLSQMEVVVQ
jgi:hypothetical protein